MLFTDQNDLFRSSVMIEFECTCTTCICSNVLKDKIIKKLFSLFVDKKSKRVSSAKRYKIEKLVMYNFQFIVSLWHGLNAVEKYSLTRL